MPTPLKVRRGLAVAFPHILGMRHFATFPAFLSVPQGFQLQVSCTNAEAIRVIASYV